MKRENRGGTGGRSDLKFNTQLLHGRGVHPYAEGATVAPIAQVTAFSYEDVGTMEKVFQHRAAGFAYSRVANPTVAAYEQRMADLEGAGAAVACTSGMSAITIALLNILSAGDEIIAGAGLYGGTLDLLEDLTKLGITTRFARHLTREEILPLVNEHTRVIFGELISNPGLEVMDIEAVAEVAHGIGVPLLVDSTSATPFLCRPLEHGADVVIHSGTKYINGSGNSVSGLIVDGQRFRWDFEKFTALSGYRKFGPMAYSIRLRTDIWENMGACLAPFNAFLNLVGLETMGLRMERICDNALALAGALRELGLEVNYPGLADHPSHELAGRLLGGRYGGLLTFRAGSKERAQRILNALTCVSRASSFGDVRTLVIQPGPTLYIRSTPEQREAAGVREDTVRVSVGIEDVEDLIADFTQAVEGAAQD